MENINIILHRDLKEKEVTICQSVSNDEVIIRNQVDLDAELSRFIWHDSFIREAHLLSPSYVVTGKRTVVAPDSLWGFRLLVCSADAEYPGIEFVFEEVEQIALSAMVDVEPYGVFGTDGIDLFLTEGDQTPIRAKRLRIRHLKADVWGVSARYSDDSLFDESGFSVEQA